MSLILFKFQLIFYLGVFCLQYISAYLEKYKRKTVFIYCFLCIFFIILFNFLSHQKANTRLLLPISYQPSDTTLFTYVKIFEENLTQEISYWQELQTKVPKSRDVLLNNAIMAKISGENAKFLLLYSKAEDLDPNHEVFSQK